MGGSRWRKEQEAGFRMASMLRLAAAAALPAAFLAAVCVAPPSARAWGSAGHKAAALVAQRRLTPRALAAVRALLGGEAGLDAIATCADGILRADEPGYDCGGVFTLAADPGRATGPWHYIHLPLGESVSAGSLAGHCPGGTNCVTVQVRLNAAVLADAAAPADRRREALMFLVHLVADEHQPLHAADDSDANGNGKSVLVAGGAKSLHSLWDDLARTGDWRIQSAPDPAALAAEVERDIREEDAVLWTSGDFVAGAALESFAIARDVIYPRCAQDRGRELGAEYEEAMRPIVRRRLAMAGVRLAALIEEALGRGALAQVRGGAAVAPAGVVAGVVPVEGVAVVVPGGRVMAVVPAGRTAVTVPAGSSLRLLESLREAGPGMRFD